MLPSPMRALGRFNHRENSPDALHVAVLTGRTKRIKHLLRKGVHIESVNTIGQTSLFCAAYGGDYEIVELLLRLGANPNRRCGSNGAAPIHAAAYRGSRRVLRLLVEAGGDLGLRDSELQTPKDYVEKQPSPLRRQKILQFIDLLYAMTLHRSSTNTMPSSMVTSSGVLSDGGSSNSGTLRSQKLKGFFGSQMSLASRKHSQSTTSVWSSCVSEVPSNSSSDELDSHKAKEIVLTENLHKNLSCHLLDQLCVTTSLPLLSPDQLQKPQTNTPAYTCGGPTVYSPFTWLGTPVTVRRPTPALSVNKLGNVTSGGDGSPDQEAVRSLLQELSFLRCLRHPGFLEVMAACHVTHPAPDHVTLVYQHVSYGSLYHHLHVKHRDLSVGFAVDILIGLVEALLFMHAHGWFHCGLSSHALHLVGLGMTKLGGFEYAMEAKVKGVGMRAEHVSRATWLKPWQAPETIVEKMVSVRSEIYAVAAIIWEIWSGMPPWAGVEEEEVGKRVGNGETLPLLGGTPLSLVSYLTQYGLKWNSHERELDLQEVYTMLRSLRIQCNEDGRVPAVSSWGPPSVLNTPVIGRRTANHEASSPLSSRSSSGELRLGDQGLLSLTKGVQVGRKWGFQETRGKFIETGGGNLPSSWRVTSGESSNTSLSKKEENFQSSFERAHEKVRQQFSLLTRNEEINSNKMPLKSSDVSPIQKKQLINEGSGDSGFSTPCSRTPSPTYNNGTTSRAPTIVTSTPAKSTTTDNFTNGEKRPDLLPSKITPKAFMASQIATHSPDVVTRENYSIAKEDCIANGNNFTYVSNAAKRAFLQNGEGHSDDGFVRNRRLSDADSAVSNLLMEKRRQVDIVKRGLSLTNLCTTSTGSNSLSTVFTRTTSHISLCSTSSASSAENIGRKPVRTISQITLTLKKLSASSSSTSSHSREDFSDIARKPKEECLALRKNTLSLPYKQSSQVIKSPPVPQARRVTKERNYEVTGIKPASHQLTRHSSSCSLASGPSSPAHQRPVTDYAALASSKQNRYSSSNVSLPTSPTHSKSTTLPPPTRPLSVFNDQGSLLQSATLPALLRIASRRHSETIRQRPRKPRRKQEVEVEEEFIDDEFNSLLYDQPHMQLSIGSSENLLDSRLSFSVVDDSASSVASQHSRHLTSSDDEDDDTSRRCKGGCRPPLQALEETGDSDNGEDDRLKPSFPPMEKSGKRPPTEPIPNQPIPVAEYSTTAGKPTRVTTSDSESDEVFSKGGSKLASSRGRPDKVRDYEPLKSFQIMKNLEKTLTNYLPTYSIGSDSD